MTAIPPLSTISSQPPSVPKVGDARAMGSEKFPIPIPGLVLDDLASEEAAKELKAKLKVMSPTAQKPLLPALARIRGKVLGWEDKSTLHSATQGLVVGGALGFITSVTQNAVQNHSHGWKGVFTRTGGTITVLTLAGGLYGLTESVTGKIRKKDDAWNNFAGGCAAGFLFGLRGKSLPLAIGSCAFLGTPVAVLKAQGGGLRGEGWEYLPREQQERRKSTFFRKPAGTQVDSTTSGPPASPSPSTNLS